ncbi:amidohydrolase [Lentinula edodes]|uniref:amidohydrolase n=1 Tax=Lentinula edodes TaxID=5353 RepID=UPI001E8EF487|nr:amidohydrolase [Lentinula edodes]KAH7870407.1 amidohydrolase [Lentinula edodes]
MFGLDLVQIFTTSFHIVSTMRPKNVDRQTSGCFGGFKLRSFVSGKQKQGNEKLPASREGDEKVLAPSRDFDFGIPSEWGLSLEQSSFDSSLPPYTTLVDASKSSAAEQTISRVLDELESELHELSMKIHDHPEIAFQERYARDTLTAFMHRHKFHVTSGYLGLETAWRAEYSYGRGGKVIGINSEMDALKGIGHACGHNLIAASGCGIAVALKVALETHDIPGKIILLGTPAEEGGGGKIILLQRGGYDEMDFCLMSHPGPGPLNSFDIGSTTAVLTFEVEYLGKGAHAGAAPWEGINALDAAFLAYSSLSVLRQQMKPTHRSHGIVQGQDWISNVIPDNARLRWQVRAPTYDELVVLAERVRKCFEAAALATGCTVKIDQDSKLPYYELKNNPILARIFSGIVRTQYGHSVRTNGSAASTDFGNVSYHLPALHPLYSIPTEPHGGNHTPAFTKASATKEAHAANMIATRGLAITGLRVIQDDELFREMQATSACHSAL